MLHNNIEDAEDMTQDIFLHLGKVLPSFRGESAFSTWLHRVAVNQVLMRVRRKKLTTVSISEQLNDNTEITYADVLVSTDLFLAGAVDRVLLNQLLLDMPVGYKTVFILHDLEGLEHHEIVARIGTSLGNSKSQLHKARIWLAERLGIVYEETDKETDEENTSKDLLDTISQYM